MATFKTNQTGNAVSKLDPFSHDCLANPYPFYEAFREAGPIVWLEKYGVWAVARYAEVRAVLSDWQTFASGYGVGIVNVKEGKAWRPPAITLEADPPLHTRTRTVLTRVMSPAAIKKLRADFELEAERLISELVERREFDAAIDLADAYPVKVFADALGISVEGRDNLRLYSTMAFNAFGPQNDVYHASMVGAKEVSEWIMASCQRDRLAPGGFGAQVYDAADAGELTMEEAPRLVRAFLTAGIDTTVYGIGNAILCFAQHPDQWNDLRANPSRARPAFEEVVRFESPIQLLFRTATRDVEIGGAAIREGEKIMVCFASANRDPRQWERPDEFISGRRTMGHVGFGFGIHGCVGQAMARLEADIVLTTLASKVRSIELAGDPVRRINNTLRGLESLPVHVTPA